MKKIMAKTDPINLAQLLTESQTNQMNQHLTAVCLACFNLLSWAKTTPFSHFKIDSGNKNIDNYSKFKYCNNGPETFYNTN